MDYSKTGAAISGLLFFRYIRLTARDLPVDKKTPDMEVESIKAYIIVLCSLCFFRSKNSIYDYEQ